MSKSDIQIMLDNVRQHYEPSEEDKDRIYKAVIAIPGIPVTQATTGKGISSLTVLKGFGATVLTLGLAAGIYYGVTHSSTANGSLSGVANNAANDSDVAQTDAPEPVSDIPAVSSAREIQPETPATALQTPQLSDTDIASVASAANVALKSQGKTSSQKGKKQHVNQSDSLATEIKLVSRAAAEINNGNPRDAMVLLSRHRRRFPVGTMAQERNGLEIIALCASGQTSKGLKKYQAFKRHSPNAPIIMRIKKTCGYE